MRGVEQINVFSFALANAPINTTVSALLSPPTAATVPGLIHAECLTPMQLGSSIFSPHRMQLRSLTMFAAWENEAAIDEFFSSSQLGKVMAFGWHLRMTFLRRWGSVEPFNGLPATVGTYDPSLPVAAYTLARLKIPEVPRFIRWGKPVEELVRDDPESTLAVAAIRYPRSVATFSIWNSLQAMTAMVRGGGNVAQPERHAIAMEERDRRNFHHEFTTLRFKPLSEHGSWEGQSNFVRRS